MKKSRVSSTLVSLVCVFALMLAPSVSASPTGSIAGMVKDPTGAVISSAKLTLVNIARNAFMELVRQPVFLLLMTFSAGFSVFLSCVPYFGFGDDPKLVKDSVLALMLLSGLFGAVLSASASVAHEIRTGTALAVLAKPVGRAQFLIGKYLGLAGALSVLTYANLVSALLASRMAFDAYGDVD